ncbi:MAG: ADP-ribosylglycohydrolase family protein, partial [Sphingomonas sp.]|uniref:ADP-ribosylglycohydrolase family protein n=1 Tax=Sphingomonas sp. TaxID=28214 RepID=UPI003F811D07
VSVPGAAFEAAWMEHGEGVRARLRDGFDIVVHCKGGLGRAGTIAARLMVELGVPPSTAVSEVRAARPGAIETDAQLNYVLGQHAMPEPTPSRSPEAIRDRAIGALLGLAVGDAVGTTLEFRARDSYPPLTDMVGGGPFNLKPGEWTDDTAMALALADTLIHCGRVDEADLMARFVRWRDEGEYSCTGTCFDIGMTVSAALASWKRTGNPIAGSTAAESAGNGSLMRLAPVAVRYWNERIALRDAAARQSRVTHGAAEAVDACVGYAELLADAIAGEGRARVLAPRQFGLAPKIDGILGGDWRGRSRHSISSSGYVAHSLEAALWSVGSTPDVPQAILAAANLGGDADTAAAIAGQLAGAIYGASGIPATWRNRVAWNADFAGKASSLAEQSGLS